LLPMASQAEKNGDGLTATLLYEIAAVAKPDSPEVFLSATDFFYRIHRLDLVENALVGLADLLPHDVIKPAINRLFFDLIQTRQLPRAFELSKKLMEKASLNDQPDVWFYCGFIGWVAGQPCDTLYCWTKSQKYGIPKEQLEPAFSQVSRFFFAHVFSM
jgi:hypothetical protein